MKKFLSYILILIIVTVSFSATFKLYAQDALGTCQQSGGTTSMGPIPNVAQKDCIGTWTANPPPTSPPGYSLLAPLPGLDTVPVADKNALGNYLNVMIKLLIGLAAVAAMVMIVMGGIQYMTSELPGVKSDGKEKITNAILGLLIALGAWLILFTINPDLLNTNVNIAQTTITGLGGESSAAFAPISNTSLQTFGVNCSPNGYSVGNVATIAQSFIGKVTYSQTKRNTTDATTIYADCSSFVDQVYACAGAPAPGNNTASIFGGSGGIDITSFSGTKVNGMDLAIGDLLGWTPSQDPKGNGHVVMYIGNGQIIDATPAGVGVKSLTTYQDRYKAIRRF